MLAYMIKDMNGIIGQGMSFLEIERTKEMKIPERLYRNQTMHYNITHSPQDGVLSCGFLHKPNAGFSQSGLVFEHYGAFLLLDGSGSYTDSEGYEYDLEPGAYIQRLPGRKHTTMVNPDGKWLEFFVCFGKKTYENLRDLKLISDTPVIYPGLTPHTFQKCNYLMECFRKLPEEQLSVLYLYSQEFAIEMFRSVRNSYVDGREFAKMQKAEELLCQRKPRFLNVREVSDCIGMSYDRFRKKFKDMYGISPGAYQIDSRINYSKTLLLDTGKNLNEIALLCNFADGFSYSKAFKKHCNISPQKFRKNHLNL